MRPEEHGIGKGRAGWRMDGQVQQQVEGGAGIISKDGNGAIDDAGWLLGHVVLSEEPGRGKRVGPAGGKPQNQCLRLTAV